MFTCALCDVYWDPLSSPAWSPWVGVTVHREVRASVSYRPVHLSQEGGDKQIGAERGGGDTHVGSALCPWPLGAWQLRRSSTRSSPGGWEGRVRECGSPRAELRLRLHVAWSLAQQAPSAQACLSDWFVRVVFSSAQLVRGGGWPPAPLGLASGVVGWAGPCPLGRSRAPWAATLGISTELALQPERPPPSTCVHQGLSPTLALLDISVSWQLPGVGLEAGSLLHLSPHRPPSG